MLSLPRGQIRGRYGNWQVFLDRGSILETDTLIQESPGVRYAFERGQFINGAWGGG